MGQRLEHTSVPTSHLNSKRQRLNSEHQTPKQVAGRCGLNFLDGIREGDAGDCIEAGAVRSALSIDGYILIDYYTVRAYMQRKLLHGQ